MLHTFLCVLLNLCLLHCRGDLKCYENCTLVLGVVVIGTDLAGIVKKINTYREGKQTNILTVFYKLELVRISYVRETLKIFMHFLQCKDTIKNNSYWLKRALSYSKEL